MPTDQTSPQPVSSGAAADEGRDAQAAGKKPLSPAAQRALAEATARRAERDSGKSDRLKEFAGRDGPEPTRYGDWEINGIASDF